MQRDDVNLIDQLNKKSRSLRYDLEEIGVTNTNYEIGLQFNNFFSTNIPQIVSACQALLRGESREKPIITITKQIEQAEKNLKDIKKYSKTHKYLEKLEQIESMINKVKLTYQEL